MAASGQAASGPCGQRPLRPAAPAASGHGSAVTWMCRKLLGLAAPSRLTARRCARMLLEARRTLTYTAGGDVGALDVSRAT